MQYRVDLQASRQVKDPAVRAQANKALRRLRENMADQTRRELTLNLVNSTSADRAWQTWFWFNHFNTPKFLVTTHKLAKQTKFA